jgi:hypothetical protein
MRIQLSYTPNNVESFDRLKDRWVDILKKAGHASTSLPLHAYFKKRIPLEGVGHQNGTCRMGNDPATSVLDVIARPMISTICTSQMRPVLSQRVLSIPHSPLSPTQSELRII